MELAVKITADAEKYVQTMKRAETVARNTAQSVGNKVSGIGRSVIGGIRKMTKVAMIGLGALAVAGGAALLSTVGPASALSESVNAVAVTFGDAQDVILDYGKTASEMVGLSNREFNQLGTTTGAFLQNLGFDAAGAAEKTIELTERAADMASVFDTDVSQALGAIQSGLKGEFNPLEQFGVKINAAAINARALEMGLAGTVDGLDDSMKAQAALALVMEQTDKVQGDFLNTSDSVANVQRRLAGKFEDVKAKIGTALLPILSDLGTKLLDVLGNPETEAFLDNLITGIGNVASSVGGFIEDFSSVFAVVKDAGGGNAEAFFTALAEGFLGIENAGPVVTQIGDGIYWLMDVFKQTVQMFQQDKGLVVSALSAIAVVILSVVVPAVISLVTTMLPIIAIMAVIAAVAYLLYTAWTQNWGGIQEKTAVAVAFIRNTVGVFLANLKAWWAENGEAIKQKVMLAWEIIKALFSMYFGVFRSLFQAFSAAFSGDWYTFGQKLREAWDNAWMLIKTVLTGAWLLLKPALISLKDNFVNYWKNIDWASVGTNIVKGIGNGMLGMLGWIASRARDVANAALEAAKGFLGIHSPSALFENVIGKNMALGMNIGFEHNLAPLNFDGMQLKPAMATNASPRVPVSTRSASSGQGRGGEEGRLLMALEEFNQRLRSFPDDLARSNESTFQKIIGGRR